jgi:two-component system, sensor histidine kinase LadS
MPWNALLTLLASLKQHRLARLFAFFGWVLWGHAAAQTAIPSNDPMARVHPALAIQQVAVLADASPSLDFDQIQTLPPSAFSILPAGPLKVRDRSWDRATWIRITLTPAPAVSGKSPSKMTLLEIPKPYLDEITLYSPNDTGWSLQRAGDKVATQDWTLPGQFPRFALPSLAQVQSSANGQLIVYLHVPHRLPMSFEAQLLSEADLASDIQQDFLLLGITVGTMAMAVALSLALLLFHRNALFAWYAVYAGAALLASLSHAGLANLYLWPNGGAWPSIALLCFMLIAAAGQLQFCKLLYMRTSGRSLPVAMVQVLGALCMVCALSLPMWSAQWWTASILVAQSLVLLSMLSSCYLIAVAWSQGNRLAMALALSFVPLFCTVSLALLDAQGMVVLPALGYNAPLYALAFEVVLLGLCLQWFGHEHYGKQERDRALASTDPLTGFLNRESFAGVLAAAWAQGQEPEQDACIAYLRVLGKDNNATLDATKLKRVVRLVRTVTREQDSVARLDERTLAVLMLGMSPGQELTERLSRLVALGLIPDRHDRRNPTLRIRVVATSVLLFDKSQAALDGDLRRWLDAPEPWERKSIHLIPKHKTSSRSFAADSEALDSIWERAMLAEGLEKR